MTSGFHLVFLLSLTGGLLISGAWSTMIKRSADCPAGWTTYGCHCYLARSELLTMADAEVTCVRLGGHLTSVHSLGEHNFVSGLIREKTGSDAVFWIGLADVLKEGTWMWTDGSLVDYTLWHTEEPNDHLGKEDCVVINYHGPTWNDFPCTIKNPFVCAKDK